MYQIAMYLRLSKEEKERGEESSSIGNQRSLIRAYLERDEQFLDCDLLEYQDDGYSGTNLERPGIVRLLSDLNIGKINCIIIKDLSRLSRDYLFLGTFLNEILPSVKVRLIAINDGYDSRTQLQNSLGLEMQYRTLMYDFYSKDISVKYKKAIMTRCAEGKYVFGRLPLGYEKIPGTQHEIRICEMEALIVRRIFAEVLQGLSVNQIAQRLTIQQVPTYSSLRGLKQSQSNVIWHSATISKIVHNRFYIGEWTYNRQKVTEVGSSHLTKRPKEEWITVLHHHVPLIEENQFFMAQEVVSSRIKSIPKLVLQSDKESIAEFKRETQIRNVRCGGCGYAMARVKLKQIYQFRCMYSATVPDPECCCHISEEALHSVICKLIQRILQSSLDLERISESLEVKWKKQCRHNQQSINQIDTQLKLLLHKKEAQYRLFREGQIDHIQYQTMIQQIEEKREQKKREKDNLNEEGEILQKRNRTRIQIQSDCEQGICSIGMINEMIDEIQVDNSHRIIILWKFRDPLRVAQIEHNRDSGGQPRPREFEP